MTWEARFWGKVLLPNQNDCMLWSEGLTHGISPGYGKFWLRGQTKLAHRISYEIAYGEIASKLVIDHICRVRRCVAPSHLRAVTDRDNLLAPGSMAAAKSLHESTACKHGHAWTPENTAIRPNGTRRCRECQARHSRNYKERKKQNE